MEDQIDSSGKEEISSGMAPESICFLHSTHNLINATSPLKQ